MNVDALVKRYFTVLVLAAVALVAWFQVSGAMLLLGAALAPPKEIVEAARLPARSGAITRTASGSRKTADAIIERNPFDGSGALKPRAGASASAAPVAEAGPKRDPMELLGEPTKAPRCTGVALSIVTESDDPVWSFAAMKGDGDSTTQLRRVGDSVGSKKVVYIGFNPEERSPAVWLRDDSQVCQALLFATQPPTQPPAAPSASAPAAGEPPAPVRPGGVPTIAPDLASKIQKVSDTEFNVDRSAVDRILADQTMLMRQARIVPEQQDGKTVGVRLFGIRKDTLLGALGLENGDRLETINGFNMASPEKALEAFARLRAADKLSVKVNRRGKATNIDLNIK